MSGFDKASALAMIEAFRTADIAAMECLARVPTLDQLRTAKESELRQSLLAILGASIGDDLCPAQALVVLQGTCGYLSGAAMRIAYEGEAVPPEGVKAMADHIVDAVAQGAGYAKVRRAAGRNGTSPADPIHPDHQTRQ